MWKRIGSAGLLLFAEAWVRTTWVDLAIRLAPFPYWRRWLGERVATSKLADSKEIAACVQAVERAARYHPFHINCLRRTLVLQQMLQRRRLPSRLHIGVRMGNNGLEAHAWLSSDGRVLNDTPDVVSRYAELRGRKRLELLAERRQRIGLK